MLDLSGAALTAPNKNPCRSRCSGTKLVRARSKEQEQWYKQSNIAFRIASQRECAARRQHIGTGGRNAKDGGATVRLVLQA